MMGEPKRNAGVEIAEASCLSMHSVLGWWRSIALGERELELPVKHRTD